VRRELQGWILEVDCLTLPDGSQIYEIEIETEAVDRAWDWVERNLRARGLRLVPQRRTKFEELIEWRRAAGAPR